MKIDKYLGKYKKSNDSIKKYLYLKKIMFYLKGGINPPPISKALLKNCKIKCKEKCINFNNNLNNIQCSLTKDLLKKYILEIKAKIIENNKKNIGIIQRTSLFNTQSIKSYCIIIENTKLFEDFLNHLNSIDSINIIECFGVLTDIFDLIKELTKINIPTKLLDNIKQIIIDNLGYKIEESLPLNILVDIAIIDNTDIISFINNLDKYISDYNKNKKNQTNAITMQISNFCIIIEKIYNIIIESLLNPNKKFYSSSDIYNIEDFKTFLITLPTNDKNEELKKKLREIERNLNNPNTPKMIKIDTCKNIIKTILEKIIPDCVIGITELLDILIILFNSENTNKPTLTPYSIRNMIDKNLRYSYNIDTKTCTNRQNFNNIIDIIFSKLDKQIIIPVKYLIKIIRDIIEYRRIYNNILLFINNYDQNIEKGYLFYLLRIFKFIHNEFENNITYKTKLKEINNVWDYLKKNINDDLKYVKFINSNNWDNSNDYPLLLKAFNIIVNPNTKISTIDINAGFRYLKQYIEDDTTRFKSLIPTQYHTILKEHENNILKQITIEETFGFGDDATLERKGTVSRPSSTLERKGSVSRPSSTLERKGSISRPVLTSETFGFGDNATLERKGSVSRPVSTLETFGFGDDATLERRNQSGYIEVVAPPPIVAPVVMPVAKVVTSSVPCLSTQPPRISAYKFEHKYLDELDFDKGDKIFIEGKSEIKNRQLGCINNNDNTSRRGLVPNQILQNPTPKDLERDDEKDKLTTFIQNYNRSKSMCADNKNTDFCINQSILNCKDPNCLCKEYIGSKEYCNENISKLISL
jgi:hypothetical protein